MITLEKKKELSSRYYRYFDQFVKIGLARMPRKQIPTLFFNEKPDTFTNKNIINIGLESPLYALCNDENDFIMITLYLLGHEMQHCLSTPDKYWAWGIEHGTRLICTKISERMEGPGKRIFRKEKDYENFVQAMKTQGLYISIPSIQRMCHFIQNSICDGRIERIRTLYHPGFRNYMIVARGKYWNKNPLINPKQYDEMDASERLTLTINQILTIATTSLYQKDFLRAYETTDITKRLDEVIVPLISRGVLSPNCKGAMAAAVEIESILADEIIEAASMSEEALEQAIKNASTGTISENAEPFIKTNEEQTAPEGDDEQNSNSATSNSSNSKGDKTSANGKGSNNQSQQSATGSFGKETEENGSKDVSNVGDSSETKNNGGDSTGGKYGLNLSNSISERNVGSTSSELSEEEMDALSESIQNAMKEAAEAVAGDVSTIQGTIPKKPTWEESKDTTPVVKELGQPEKYDKMRFDEYRRAYNVATPMPIELEARAESFANKVNRLFQNQRKPVVRGHQSGHIDAGHLYKLMMKQTDFYSKKGQIPEFNGCAYLLQDNSGSMGYGRGSKREYCCEAMAIVEHGFKRHMPIKMVAFDSDGTNQVTHEVIKGFDEKLHASCAYNFFLHGRNGGGNKDGYSIRIATKELLSRPEKEKILIVASDGCPSCYNDYTAGMADVKDAVKEARKHGIRVVGIYFADDYDSSDEADSFASMYEYDYVCTVPERVEHELVRILQNFVFTS